LFNLTIIFFIKIITEFVIFFAKYLQNIVSVLGFEFFKDHSLELVKEIYSIISKMENGI
jgi:hypothetical protein